MKYNKLCIHIFIFFSTQMHSIYLKKKIIDMVNIVIAELFSTMMSLLQ